MTIEHGTESKRFRFLSVALVIWFLPLVLTLYTLLHEGGHALVGLLFGGRVCEFTVDFLSLSAHVGIDGDFVLPQRALIDAAGVSLPVLVWIGFLMLAPRKTDPVLGWFKLILSMCTINSMLAWIIIPLLVMFGGTASDDSFNFLNRTSLPPLVVSGVALLAYLVGWTLFLHCIGGGRAFVDQFKRRPLDLSRPDTRKALWSLAALAVFVFALTAALTLALPGRGFLPPADYTAAATVRLSDGNLQDSMIYRFSLDHPLQVSIFVSLERVGGGSMQIRIVGSNGYENVPFYVPDPDGSVMSGSVHPQRLALDRGDYEIRSTFPRGQGTLRFYIKTK